MLVPGSQLTCTPFMGETLEVAGNKVPGSVTHIPNIFISVFIIVQDLPERNQAN